jgi:U6 snRNA-associated Sm-like protein LSm6
MATLASNNPATAAASTAATTTSSLPTKRTPTDFLKSVLGRPVIVKLNNGIVYRGILCCLDGFMNVALEQTEEYDSEFGQLKAKYGDALIRGNNILYISTQKKKKAAAK